MVSRSLQFRFSLWISVLIVVLIGTLSGLLLIDFRANNERLQGVGTAYLQDARVEQVYRRINLAAATLGENLIPPLKNDEQEIVRSLLQNTVKQHNFLFAEVFDVEGNVIHSGVSELEIANKTIEEPRYLKHVRRGTSPLLIPDDYQLVVIQPLWAEDQPLGGLRVALDVRLIEADTLTMTGAFSSEINQSQKETRTTVVATAVAAMLLGLLFAVGVAGRFVAPIRELAKRSDEIGKGNQVTKLISTREDELGDLIDAFNRMSEQIQKTTVSRDFVYHIIGGMNDALTVVNAKGFITLANKASSRILGTPQHSVEGEQFINFVVESDSQRIGHWLESIADKGSAVTETYLWTGEEVMVPVSLSASVLSWDSHGPLIVCVAQDISERRRDEERIRYLAQYDSLTGLANRALFMDRLNHAMQQAEVSEHLIALLFIDIDKFKRINDSLGQTRGDELLRQVAERLRQCVRQGDTVARLAGDEFVIILELLHRAEWVEPVVEKILQRLKEPFDLGADPVYASASIGIAYYPFSKMTAEELVKKADLAMYRAKDQGRATFCYYSTDIAQYQREELSLEAELRRTVDDEGFHLMYQPQVSIETGEVVGVEALLRWDHAKLGDIPRDNFIPLLEDLGLITGVGYWVLNDAARAAKEWAKTRPIRVSVNFSTLQFLDEQLLERLSGSLKEIDLPPELLEVEITETSLMSDMDKSQEVIKGISDMGISVAVDDFGTGYSSFEYLQKFEVSALKVDRAFVRGLPEEQSSKAICSAIIGLGKIMNLRVVVEGVETQGQLDAIEEMGALESQGYYSGKPMSEMDIQRLIERPID